MLTKKEISQIDSKIFEIKEISDRAVWIKSRLSGQEFIITDLPGIGKHHAKYKHYQWHVFHRHTPDEECHYHANEKSFADAIKHMKAHDRGAAYRLQHYSIRKLHNGLVKNGFLDSLDTRIGIL